MINGT